MFPNVNMNQALSLQRKQLILILAGGTLIVNKCMEQIGFERSLVAPKKVMVDEYLYSRTFNKGDVLMPHPR